MSTSNIGRVFTRISNGTDAPILIAARGFAHNPKWLREKTRHEENLLQLKQNLLDDNHIRKPTGVRRRILKTYGNQNLPPLTERKNITIEHLTTPDVESWIFNLARNRVGILPLDKTVYDADTSRTDIIHQVINWQRAGSRQGTHMSMNRHEMSGSTRKYRRQKGTGGARSSDFKSPIFRGGAYAHPRRPRDYSYDIPTNVRRLALKIALSSKRKEGKLAFVDTASVDTHKARALESTLKAWNCKKNILIIYGNQEEDPNFILAARNLQDVDILPARGANVLDIIKAPLVLMTLQAHIDLLARTTKSNSIVNVITDTVPLMSESDAAAARAKFLAELEANEQQ